MLKKMLRPNRVLNAFKLYFSYHLSKITGNNIHWGTPMSVSIEPTTSCNLRCPQCPSGLREFSRPTGMLDLGFYETIIDQLSPNLSYLTLYFQGEPFLNKDFLPMVAYANKKDVYTATSSNAHYFTPENAKKTVESGLSKVIISIDGITPETYKKYRIGGDLDKVLSGTQELIKQKKEAKSSTPHIVWQFIVFGHNEHELEEVKKMANEFGVDELAIKTAQIYDFANGNDLLPEDENYSRYVKDGDSFKIKNKLLNHCWRMWQGCVITWDGLIAPCCFDKDAEHRMGDLKEKSFKEIWLGQQYRVFRGKVLNSRKNIDICTNCTEGTKVWAEIE